MTTAPMTIGVIGCGNISDTYFRNAPMFGGLLHVGCCADMIAAKAEEKAAAFGIRAVSVEQMLADPAVTLIVNLTVPAAHADIALKAIAAGKHVYGEKPLAATVAEAWRVIAAADQKGVRIGSAPDTILGAAHQSARAMLDAGRIGKVVAGTASVLDSGMEDWHPNPGFFFAKGGGPVLDMGPYYVASLVALLGPVLRVASIGTKAFGERRVKIGPDAGTPIAVEVATTVNSVLEFAGGASVAFSASWDVVAPPRPHIELFGTEGSLTLPDPNWFGGEVAVFGPGSTGEPAPEHHPFGGPNKALSDGLRAADYRMAGVADMVAAIRGNRDHRLDGTFALHVLEILQALETSSIEGRHVEISSTCQRPQPLPAREGEAWIE